MIPQKKLKSKTKHSQVPLVNKQYIINPKKAVVFQRKKDCQHCDDNFFRTKITTAQIASQMMANPVEWMNRTTMNASRFLN